MWRFHEDLAPGHRAEDRREGPWRPDRRPRISNGATRIGTALPSIGPESRALTGPAVSRILGAPRTYFTKVQTVAKTLESSVGLPFSIFKGPSPRDWALGRAP